MVLAKKKLSVRRKSILTGGMFTKAYLVVRSTIRGVNVGIPDALVAVQTDAEANVGDDPVCELGLYLCRENVQRIAAERAWSDLRVT